MSKFMEVYEPVEEGWGNALVTIAGLAGALVGITTGAAPLTAVALGSQLLQHGVNRVMLKKILDQPKLQKYILKQCDEAFKKVKSKKPNITPDVSRSDVILPNTNSPSTLNNPSEMVHKSASLKHQHCVFKVGKYMLGVYGDTAHIDAVVLYMKQKDINPPILYRYNIPAPTCDDIKEMGYRKE